ncbi:MAG: hypothetical protein WAU75_14055 [Solirubrobacteraceae bacterium]
MAFGHRMAATTSSRRLLSWTLVVVAVLLVAMAALALAIVVTGRGGTPRAIGLRNLPMLEGTRVLTQVRSCDRSVSAYCALQVVVVDEHYGTSAALRLAYAARLAKLGWTASKGPVDAETAADSPGHELRLTYATAYGELTDIDVGSVQRTAAISHALSDTIFNRTPALSLMLTRGPS